VQVILVRERAWKEVHSYLAKLKKPSYCIDLQNKLIKTSPRYLTLEFLVEIIAFAMEANRTGIRGNLEF
jgi:hypothetical protein